MELASQFVVFGSSFTISMKHFITTKMNWHAIEVFQLIVFLDVFTFAFRFHKIQPQKHCPLPWPSLSIRSSLGTFNLSSFCLLAHAALLKISWFFCYHAYTWRIKNLKKQFNKERCFIRINTNSIFEVETNPKAVAKSFY